MINLIKDKIVVCDPDNKIYILDFEISLDNEYAIVEHRVIYCSLMTFCMMIYSNNITDRELIPKLFNKIYNSSHPLREQCLNILRNKIRDYKLLYELQSIGIAKMSYD